MSAKFYSATVMVLLALTLWLAFLPSSERPRALPVHENLATNFSLTSTEGKPVQLENFRGSLLLLTFGYTACPHTCPMNLQRVGDLLTEYQQTSVKLQGVFVAFDGHPDRVNRLKNYLSIFDSGIVGLTGPEAETYAVADQFGAVFLPGTSATEAYQHNDYIYLIDAAGEVRAIYDGKVSSAKIKADIKLLSSIGAS